MPIHCQKKKKWGFPLRTAGRWSKTNNVSGDSCIVFIWSKTGSCLTLIKNLSWKVVIYILNYSVDCIVITCILNRKQVLKRWANKTVGLQCCLFSWFFSFFFLWRKVLYTLFHHVLTNYRHERWKTHYFI